MEKRKVQRKQTWWLRNTKGDFFTPWGLHATGRRRTKILIITTSLGALSGGDKKKGITFNFQEQVRERTLNSNTSGGWTASSHREKVRLYIYQQVVIKKKTHIPTRQKINYILNSLQIKSQPRKGGERKRTAWLCVEKK